MRSQLSRIAVGLGVSVLALISLGSLLTQESYKAVAESLQQTPVFPEDGVYLYGQTPKPDQLGQAYLVFEVNDGQMVGAFYMPHSSFDCFQGQVQAEQVALTIVNSYEQVAYPYTIALEHNGAVAGDLSALPHPNLAGFHPITTVSENDRRILQVCLSHQSAVPKDDSLALTVGI